MKKIYSYFIFYLLGTSLCFAQEYGESKKNLSVTDIENQQPILIYFNNSENLNIDKGTELINKIAGFKVNEFCSTQKGFLCVVDKKIYPTLESLYLAFEKVASYFPKYTISTASIPNVINIDSCN